MRTVVPTEAKRFAYATKAGHTIRATSRPVASISTNATPNTVHQADVASMLYAAIAPAVSLANVHLDSRAIQRFNVTTSTNARHRIDAAKVHNASTRPVHSNAFVLKARFLIQIQVYAASRSSRVERIPIVQEMLSAMNNSDAYARRQMLATIVGIRVNRFDADRMLIV